MGDLSGFSNTLATSRREKVDMLRQLVEEAKKTPEYHAYEAAVISASRAEDNYLSPSHPASEVNAYDHQLQMKQRQRDINELEKKLRERVSKDGIADDHIDKVMNAITDKAVKAAEQATRAR